MKNKINTLVFVSILISVSLFCASSNSKTSNSETLYNEWYQKRIVLPDSIVFTKMATDTVDYSINTKCKIFLYIDSTGCTICKMKILEWTAFLTDLADIAGDKVSHLFVINPPDNKTTIREIKSSLTAGYFDFPIYLDYADSINKLNHFPTDERFRCFLLDENDHVVLIGNPLHNQRFRELYLKTICEKLGIDYTSTSSKENVSEINFGIFPKSEIKTVKFYYKNPKYAAITVDTLYTSCKCIVANTNKKYLRPSETATITVSYTPDAFGEFYREVHLKIKGIEKPLVFTIRGVVE